MKKTIRVVMAFVMVMMLSVTAFAAPSPSGSVSVKGATDKNGNAVNIVIAESTNTEAKEKLATTEALKAVLGAKFKEGMTVLSIKDVSLDSDAEFPITVTFDVEADCVLHYNSDGNWVDVTKTSANGTVTAEFNDFSPVAFVGTKTDAAATTTSGTTSQKTNESAMPYVIGIVAVLAIAGVAVLTLSKKKKA